MAQFDWKVLGTKVKTYTVGTTAAAILADITALSIPGAVDVSSKSVRQTLYKVGAWSAIVKKANAAAAGTDTTEGALACQMLVQMAGGNDTLMMSDPAIATQLQADIGSLVAANVITQNQANAALALASTSWAAQNGWSGVSVDQVTYAMSTAVQNDPALGIS